LLLLCYTFQLNTAHKISLIVRTRLRYGSGTSCRKTTFVHRRLAE